MLRFLPLLLAPLLLQAQGTEPKAAPGDYPARATLDKLAIGAEYLVHSFFGHGQTFFTSDYLVVEVALFPARDETLTVSQGQFTLRINGKKQPILPQAPGFVAASLKYPDWVRRPTLEAAAGTGNAGVILGRPERVERFPGDPRPRQTRLPQPPRTPEAEKEPPVSADQVVSETALPEREARGPISGYLYFAYKGKTKSIRSLELIYAGPAGTAVLKLL